MNSIPRYSPERFSGLRLMLCTNGCSTTLPALEYGVWLAGLLQAPVLLLGIVEVPGQRESVERVVAETARRLEENRIRFQVEIDSGRGTLVVGRHAQSGTLTIAGPLGRPAWRRMFQGRSFRRLLARIETPIIYVPTVRLPLQSLLLCLGGLGYAEDMFQLGLHLALKAGAALTLLHVVEPITLDYRISKEIHDNLDNILETDTPQGRNLSETLETARAAGVSVNFKVRQGSAVHTILEEIHTGQYDLVGMGSAYSAQSLRHLYMPNVTAEVAEVVSMPILTVRQRLGVPAAPGG